MKRREVDLISDERGGYQTEYTIVLVLVAIVFAVAIAALSLPLIAHHRDVQQLVLGPAP